MLVVMSSLSLLLVLHVITCASAFTFTTPIQKNHRPLNVLFESTTSSTLFEEYSQTDLTHDDLACKDIITGTGDDVAEEGSFVTVAYKGTLMSNGKQFDEGSISFRLGEQNVIPGWERGIMGMKVGGQRILKIPPQLAYGQRGAGTIIPPNSHLVFETELKGIARNHQIEEVLVGLSSMNPINMLVFALVIGNIIYMTISNK